MKVHRESQKERTNINTPTNASVMLNRADFVDKKTAKYECNEKGRDLTQKEQKMQGERLITKPSPILPLTKAKWCIYANM